MHFALRSLSRVARARPITPFAPVPRYTVRFNQHGSYGNDQSGHPQANKDVKNPREDLEHPGPKSPVEDGSSTDSSSGSSSKSSSSSSSVGQEKKPGSSTEVGGGSSSTSSQGGSPAITQPLSTADKDDPEVKKHNDDMAQRSDRTTNQLEAEEQKVDKQFWKGDVGDQEKNSKQ